jgi:hypothetical protein
MDVQEKITPTPLVVYVLSFLLLELTWVLSTTAGRDEVKLSLKR